MSLHIEETTPETVIAQEVANLAAFLSGGAFDNYPNIRAHILAHREGYTKQQHSEATLKDLLIISMAITKWRPGSELMLDVISGFLNRIGGALYTEAARKQMLDRLFSTTEEIKEGINEPS